MRGILTEGEAPDSPRVAAPRDEKSWTDRPGVVIARTVGKDSRSLPKLPSSESHE